MTNIFEECLRLKLELDALRPLKKEDEIRIMQKFRLDWNYHSNHLEGNSLTYGETKALILFGITAQGKPLKDHFEVTGHDNAISWILSLVEQERPLSENFIKELHTLILKESYEVDAITPNGQPTKKRVKVGEYKTTPNHVKTKTGEIFRFATPEETPIVMNELVQWYNEKSDDPQINPILLAAEFHYKYIRIHPFDDGNGRTARILMNFILLRFGYPPVIVKTEDKLNYFAALRQADAGILQPFFEYIGNNLKQSLKLIISGAKGEEIEESDDWEKKLALLNNQLQNNDVKKIKSKALLVARNKDTFIPMIELFYEKLAKFDSSFVTTVKKGGMYYEPQNVGSISLFSYESFISSLKGSLNWDNVYGMKMIMIWEAIKTNDINEVNKKIEVNFNFEYKYKYEISVKGIDGDLFRLYTQPVSKEDQLELVNKVGNYLIDSIKNSL